MSDRVAFSLGIAGIGVALVVAGVVGVVRSERAGPLTWGTTQADIARVLLGVLTCLSVTLVAVGEAHWWWWATLAAVFPTVMAYHYIRYGTEPKPETFSGFITRAGLGFAAAPLLGFAEEVLFTVAAFLILGLGLALFQLLFG